MLSYSFEINRNWAERFMKIGVWWLCCSDSGGGENGKRFVELNRGTASLFGAEWHNVLRCAQSSVLDGVALCPAISVCEQTQCLFRPQVSTGLSTLSLFIFSSVNLQEWNGGYSHFNLLQIKPNYVANRDLEWLSQPYHSKGISLPRWHLEAIPAWIPATKVPISLSARLSVSLAYETALCNLCYYSVELWHTITQYV